MSRVLVTEKIAPTGLEVLEAAGHDVDVRLGLSPDELLDAVPGAHALIVRSATQVDAAVLQAGADLVAVGRAGVGLDNVDTTAATDRGVMVVNAPESNITSAAEHTMAMLLAQARNIPQAHAALVAGRWERSQWEGVELAGKSLGVIGLGRIGTLVAQRAAAFGMRVIAHDPFVSADAAARLDIDLVSLDDLLGAADFVTIHVAKTPETIGLINKDRLARAKPNLRIVNVARGGLIDETALADAVRSRQIAGAAVDVFDDEPTTDSPLIGVPGIIVTPHLGASTREAQDRAGEQIAEQIVKALAGDFVPFAVNVAAGPASSVLREHLPLCEQLGVLFAGLTDQLPGSVDIELRGDVGEGDPSLGKLSFLKGLLGATSSDPVSYVNAADLAAARGIDVRMITAESATGHVNVVQATGGELSVAGTISRLDGRPRLLELDGHRIEVGLSAHMLVIRNEDIPGVVGRVGMVLGDAGINISDMHIGERAGMASVMVISTDVDVPPPVRDALEATTGVHSVRAVRLG